MNLKFRHWQLWHWLILALAIRLYKLTQTHCIAKDGARYIDVAWNWIRGPGGFHPVWPPLYPWLISLLIRFGIEPELSGQLISVIFGVLTVAMVYIVTKSMFSPGLARVSTVFAVFHPYLVRYSAEVLSDSLFTFLIIAVVFWGWLGLSRKGPVPVLFVGVGTALAYFTKPEGVFLIVVISMWWIFSRGLWHKKLAVIVCAWGIILILVFPYLYSIHNKTGQWMISQKQNIVFSAALQDEGFTDELLDVSPLEYAMDNPKVFFVKIGKSFLTLLGRFPDACHPLLFIFLIIGLFTRRDPSQKRTLWFIISFLILYFIGYAVFHPGRRYLVNWVPLLFFLAAMGWERITEWFHPRRIGTMLLLVTILILIPKTLEPIRKTGIGWKEAGLWIKEHSGTKGSVTVMAEDGRVAFYAQAQHIPWDKDRFGEADYIVSKENIYSMKEAYCTPRGLRIYHDSNFTK